MHARAGAVLLVACALSAIVGVPFAAGAVAPRSAQVTPASELGDQVVRVTWQHFRPTRTDGLFRVVIMQCSVRPTSVERDCNMAEKFPLSLTGNQARGVTESDGTGSVFIDILSTARLPALACSGTHPCSLLLYEETIDGFDTGGLPADYTTVPLKFRKSAADCPPVTHFDLRLESEASAAAAFYQWATDLCSITGAFTIDVTNTSSNAARHQFFAGNVDIGVSSLPPQPGEEPLGTPAYTVTPVDLTGIVIAYNIVDPRTHQRITDITLTPRLVARLVSDSDVLTFFSDPEFKQLNPNHHYPSIAADPGVRAEQNADTWIVTNWLNSNPDARNFLNGRDRYGIPVNPAWRGVHYPTDVFEARNPNGVYLPRTGQESIGQRVFHSTKPADSIGSAPDAVGFFGILDLPTARRYSLPVAKLTNGPGKPSVEPSVASIQAGYRAMPVSERGYRVTSGVPSDPAAYPLTKVDHALTPNVVANSITRARIEYLMGYAVGRGQHTLPPGFVEFPRPLPPPTTTTTSTTTSTTTTTTTTTTTLPVGTASSQTPFDPSPGVGTDASSPPPAVAVARTPTRRTTAPQVATPKLRLISQVDGLALPIVLVLGMLALVYCLIDVTRRRGPEWVAFARRWRATRGRAEASP